MKITNDFIEQFEKWENATPDSGNTNHWLYDNDETYLSIRATHPDMEEVHIAPRDGWVVEIHPAAEWPIFDTDSDILRFHPDTSDGVRRTIFGLMFGVVAADE